MTFVTKLADKKIKSTTATNSVFYCLFNLCIVTLAAGVELVLLMLLLALHRQNLFFVSAFVRFEHNADYFLIVTINFL